MSKRSCVVITARPSYARIKTALTAIEEHPDLELQLVVGASALLDRYEMLATAIAGSYMNIPVAHVQGGEVTGSIDEKVRHAVTKLALRHLGESTPTQEMA